MKKKRTTERLEGRFLKLLPEVGTKEHDQLIEDAKSLTTANCGWIEYGLAQILKTMYLPPEW